MIGLKEYQMAFTSHIRDPKNIPLPEGVNARGMAVYTEIVFNNIESSIAVCFPVLKKVLGEAIWLSLVREFFIKQPCTTPIFREIPEAFLAFINHVSNLPPYAQNLAHYEWIELYLAYSNEAVDVIKLDVESDLLDYPLVFVPAMALLSYDYPVHQISPENIPLSPLETPVNLLVYRDAMDQVKFVELNQITLKLLGVLKDRQLTARQALIDIASAMQFIDIDLLVNYGLEILRDLKSQGVILGVLNTNRF